MARLKKLFILAAALALLAWPSGGGAQQRFDRGILLQNAAVAVGNGSTLNVADYQSVAFQVVGTNNNLEVLFQGSLDNGTTWNALICYPADSATGTAAPAWNNIYRCNTQGVPLIRARISAYYGGTINIRAYPSKFPFNAAILTP